MSGQQIGSVVGGVIGAYFGGPTGYAIGSAIGGAIGGYVDPTRINGPHIGDGQQQAATDGVPIAWVQGEAFVAGCVIGVGPRFEKKVKDSGKGSGTVTSHYEAHQSFAILVCESSELRDSVMVSVLAVEQDGKIVYDVRPGSQILPASGQWGSGVTFMFGAEDQLPNATMESIWGVGSTPAYRGRLVAVFTNFNLTKAGDRIPVFRFLVKSSGTTNVNVAFDDLFRYKSDIPPASGDYSGKDYDDSSWDEGQGGFGDGWITDEPHVNTHISDVAQYQTIWLRKRVLAPVPTDLTVTTWHDNAGAFWWNGVPYTYVQDPELGTSIYTIPASAVENSNVAVMRSMETGHVSPGANFIFAAMEIKGHSDLPDPDAIPLSVIVRRICKRGGLDDGEIDAIELNDIAVQGYPIATAATAADCAAPVLAAYFAYGAEYDLRLHFRRFGADAFVSVDRNDIVETDSNPDGASIIATNRSQATEFPAKITCSYYDPDQNFNAVNTSFERNSSDVVAIGEQQYPLPVVMKADAAAQAAAKAMKVAYAALEGTREYSVPLAGRSGQVYLTLAPGDSVLLDGKRWGITELTLSAYSIHLKTTYNRQSAYTSNVQAIPGNPPTVPLAPYTGPTDMYVMNLPSLRPQDTYGVYVALTGESPTWPGATVQVSYDGGVTWQNTVTGTIRSTMGEVTVDQPVGGEPLTVSVNDDLESIDAATLAARGNAAAVLSAADVAEILQFQTATESVVTAGTYALTDLVRGGLGTPASSHVVGERFTMLDSVYFIPIDLQFGGDTLLFRAVGIGTQAEAAEVISLVYRPDDTVILDGGSPGA